MYTSIHPILNGEKSSGVTLHKIDDGIDTGDIIDSIEFPIEIYDTSRNLYFKYLKYGTILFKKNIEKLITGDYNVRKQSYIESSYYSRHTIDFKNFNINLNKTSYDIHNQIRAYIFKEYQFPTVNGFKIVSSELSNKYIGINKFTVSNRGIVMSGIDGFKITLKSDD